MRFSSGKSFLAEFWFGALKPQESIGWSTKMPSNVAKKWMTALEKVDWQWTKRVLLNISYFPENKIVDNFTAALRSKVGIDLISSSSEK